MASEGTAYVALRWLLVVVWVIVIGLAVALVWTSDRRLWWAVVPAAIGAVLCTIAYLVERRRQHRRASATATLPSHDD